MQLDIDGDPSPDSLVWYRESHFIPEVEVVSHLEFTQSHGHDVTRFTTLTYNHSGCKVKRFGCESVYRQTDRQTDRLTVGYLLAGWCPGF